MNADVPILAAEKKTDVSAFFVACERGYDSLWVDWVVVFTVGLGDILRVPCHCGEHVSFVSAR